MSAIRMTGLTSGLDTEAIVSAMVSTYVAKKEKYQKAQQKLDWTKDAWASVNKQVYSLYSSVSNLRFSSAYSSKKATASDTTKATVTAASGAANGTQTLSITKLAKAAYITGAELASGTTASTTLGTLLGDNALGKDSDGNENTTTITLTNKATGKTKDITLSDSTTISSLVNTLKDNGLSASFDTTYRRLYISAKDSGEDNGFTLTADSESGLQALSAFGVYSSSSAQTSATYLNYAQYDSSEVKSTLNTIYDAYTAMTNYAKNVTTAKSAKAELTSKQDYLNAVKATSDSKYDDLKAELLSDSPDADTVQELAEEVGLITTKFSYTDGDDTVSFTMVSENEDGTYTAEDADGNTVTINSATDDEGNTTYSYTDGDGTVHTVNKALDTTDYDTFRSNLGVIKEYKEASDDNETYAESVEAMSSDELDTEIASIASQISDKETYIEEQQANADTEQETLDNYSAFMTTFGITASTLKAEDIDSDDDTLITSIQSKIAMGQEYKTAYDADAAAEAAGNTPTAIAAFNSKYGLTSGATIVEAQNAQIVLNGVTYDSDDNSFSINGLTIQALATTSDDITITTDTDTQGLYDKIKDFLSSYNDVINNMMELYNADSASGYDPLTDDEKESMTDSQIEKWETKIKDALLRHDSTLNSIINTMTSSMSAFYNVTAKDGSTKSYGLTTLGISTLGYLNAAENENYAYHIDGDEDDSYTSTKTDKLLAALQDDPDAVIDFVKQLASGLYTNLGNKMKMTTLSSSYTIYNDKEMASEYSDYTDLISTWETRIADKEDYYYSKFSSMESSLAKLQSSSSALGTS